MNRPREFGALLRRSSQPTVDRALLFLYALLERSSCRAAMTDQDDDTDWSAMSLPSLLAVLRLCFPGLPPRFLFVLGENGHLLRSADRGLSWKRVLPILAATTKTDSGTSTGGAEEEVTLESITALLPREDDVEDEPAPKANGTSRSDTNKVRIKCLVASNDVVVCGGEDGLLIVSGNRGVTFQDLPGFFLRALAPCSDAKLSVDHLELMPESPSATTGFLLYATVGMNVLLTALTVSGVGEVVVTDPKVVLTCTTPIALLRCDGCASSSMSGHIVVSEHRSLHVSWDRGATFWRIPHQLGYVRDVASTSCVRHSEAPPFPSSSRIVQSIVSTKSPQSKPHTQNSAAGAFEYSSAFEQTLPYEVAASLRHTCTRQLRLAKDDDIFFTHLFVSGEGTDVLPYDFSCMLCIGVAIRDCTVRTFSLAENVSFVPYVRSSLSEPVCCVAQRQRATATGLMFARANSSGTSFSRDGVNWSDPKKSAAVALLLADGDALLAVGQRSMVTQFSPGATSSHVLPTSLRVPMLRAAATL